MFGSLQSRCKLDCVESTQMQRVHDLTGALNDRSGNWNLDEATNFST